MESEKIISALEFGIKATDCKGDYPTGFRNGLRYAKSLISGEEPIFESCEERHRARWIIHKEHCEMNNLLPSGLGGYFWCSECDCGIDTKAFCLVEYNYCPVCGAKMDEEHKYGKD